MNTEKLKQDIIENIKGCGLALETVLHLYQGKGLSDWDLRKLHAEAKRMVQQELLSESDIFSVPSFEPGTLTKKAVEAIQAGWLRPLRLDMPALAPSKPLFERNGNTYLVGSDIHAPDQDDHALDVFFQIGRTLPLDGVIINGDLDDVHALSRYTPNAEKHLRWVDERAEAHKVRARIRQNFSDTPIHVIPGNHDVRPLNWIDSHAMPLQGLFTLEQLLGWDDPLLEFDVIHEGRLFLAEDNLLVKHGVKIGQHAGTSVKKEVDAHGMSVIMGHVHRRAIIDVTKTAHELVGVELGCLCNRRPSYLSAEETANWQHGFAVVTEYGGGEFEVELVRVNDGKALFRGKRFVSRV